MDQSAGLTAMMNMVMSQHQKTLSWHRIKQVASELQNVQHAPCLQQLALRLVELQTIEILCLSRAHSSFLVHPAATCLYRMRESYPLPGAEFSD